MDQISLNDHLQSIKRAQSLLLKHIRRTPLIRSDWLSDLTGGDIYLKMENLQVTKSFKARGALYKLMRLADSGVKGPLLAVSAGNHGQGLGWASKIIGYDATVIVPKTAPKTKIEAIRRRGANLRIEGKDYDEAEMLAREESEATGVTFVSPYNDIDVIHGQGTVALDILSEQPAIEEFVIPVGGGGLLAGVGLAAKALNSATRVIGVQAENSAAMYHSLRAKEIITIVDEPTIADGLSGNLEAGSCTFPIIQSTTDDMVIVSETEIKRALLATLENEGILLEASATVGIAALMSGKLAVSGKSTALVLTGGNIDYSKLVSLISTS